MTQVTLAVALAVAGACLTGPSAAGQTPSPSPRAPTLTGEVSGGRAVGGEIRIRLDASMPGGWDGLHLVETVLLVGGREAERLTYDIEDARLAVAGQRIFVGTGAEASGAYLRVNGAQVVVTTGGADLSLRLTAEVLRAIPESARFRLSVAGDRGESAAVTRRLAQPETGGGLTWTTVLAAILVALLLGGFVGNTFASRRRPPPRLSLYGSIQRRLDDERSTGAPKR